MSGESLENIEIGRASLRNQGAALWLATGARSRHASRGRVTALLAAEKQGKVSFDGLLAATQGGRVVGAAWCLNQPGRIATIWGPGSIHETPSAVAKELIERSIKFAKHAGSHLIQSLVGAENPAAAEHLTQAGFRSITLLDQLHAFPTESAISPPSGKLTFTPCEDFQEKSFEQLVAKTYEGSLDCPEIDGLRKIEDVLAGYYASCNQNCEHWYRVRLAEETAGVIILAHHPASHQLELIYFGLLPKFRQQRLGGEILRFVFELARQLNCETIMTGVDQRNAPAMILYRQFGFQRSDSKELLLLPLTPRNAAVA